MSGLVKRVKKHWKRKLRTFKKYWKVAAIAVAAYFTFGLALGAMGPAAGATAAASSGATAAAAGGGVFSATGAAVTAGTIETVTVTAAAAGAGASAAAGTAAVAAGAAAAGSMAGGSSAAQPPAAEGAGPAGGGGAGATPAKQGLWAKTKGAVSDLSFADKLILAKTGVDVVAGLTAPSAEDEAAAAAKWQGSFYGMTAAEADKAASAPGKTQFVQPATQSAKPAAIAPGGGPERDLLAPPTDPGRQPAAPGTPMPVSQFKPQQSARTEQPAPTAQQVTNQGGNRDLFATRAPGVRYLA
jgi:hypothetical protein